MHRICSFCAKICHYNCEHFQSTLKTRHSFLVAQCDIRIRTESRLKLLLESLKVFGGQQQCRFDLNNVKSNWLALDFNTLKAKLYMNQAVNMIISVKL